MNIIERIHQSYILQRRVEALAAALSPFVPPNVSLLDVGCGDGLLANHVKNIAHAESVTGIDVFIRPKTHIPVIGFDGVHIPFPNGSFDAVMFVDVLHHTDDPLTLLREAARVSRNLIVIKDHTMEGAFAEATLRLMDRIGNRRHDVALPYNYWSRSRWLEAFKKLYVELLSWTNDVPLYPPPLSWIFGRSLHFIAQLRVPPKELQRTF